jgi:hypothetical protein
MSGGSVRKEEGGEGKGRRSVIASHEGRAKAPGRLMGRPQKGSRYDRTSPVTKRSWAILEGKPSGVGSSGWRGFEVRLLDVVLLMKGVRLVAIFWLRQHST